MPKRFNIGRKLLNWEVQKRISRYPSRTHHDEEGVDVEKDEKKFIYHFARL